MLPPLAAALRGVTRVQMYLSGERISGNTLGEVARAGKEVGVGLVLPSGMASFPPSPRAMEELI